MNVIMILIMLIAENDLENENVKKTNIKKYYRQK